MTHRPDRDATGKTPGQRFVMIRECFLEQMAASGQSRAELYSRPRPDSPDGMSEEQVVRHWAGQLQISVNDMCIGIRRAFEHARGESRFVTSFRYCQPHIVARWNELRESRLGLGPQATDVDR